MRWKIEHTLSNQRTTRDRMTDLLQAHIAVEHLRRRRLHVTISSAIAVRSNTNLHIPERTKTYLPVATTFEQWRRPHQSGIIIPQHRVRLSLTLHPHHCRTTRRTFCSIILLTSSTTCSLLLVRAFSIITNAAAASLVVNETTVGNAESILIDLEEVAGGGLVEDLLLAVVGDVAGVEADFRLRGKDGEG